MTAREWMKKYPILFSDTILSAKGLYLKRGIAGQLRSRGYKAKVSPFFTDETAEHVIAFIVSRYTPVECLYLFDIELEQHEG